MPKRKKRAVDLIRVHTENELCGEGPKLIFSIENDVSSRFNNNPYGRAVSASYTSDTSSEWETSDEEEESEIQGAVGLSEEKKEGDPCCKCQVDKNEPGSSVASECNKCNKSNDTSQDPDDNRKKRKTKKTKKQYHQCQLLRNFRAYTLEHTPSQFEDGSNTITDEERERMFIELLEREEAEEML